jgi:hypothetical protein
MFHKFYCASNDTRGNSGPIAMSVPECSLRKAFLKRFTWDLVCMTFVPWLPLSSLASMIGRRGHCFSLSLCLTFFIAQVREYWAMFSWVLCVCLSVGALLVAFLSRFTWDLVYVTFGPWLRTSSLASVVGLRGQVLCYVTVVNLQRYLNQHFSKHAGWEFGRSRLMICLVARQKLSTSVDAATKWHWVWIWSDCLETSHTCPWGFSDFSPKVFLGRQKLTSGSR